MSDPLPNNEPVPTPKPYEPDRRVVDFISRYSQSLSALVKAYNDARVLHAEYVAMGYNAVIKDEDFVGDLKGRKADDLAAAITSVESIGEHLATGHNTNIYRMKA